MTESLCGELDASKENEKTYFTTDRSIRVNAVTARLRVRGSCGGDTVTGASVIQVSASAKGPNEEIAVMMCWNVMGHVVLSFEENIEKRLDNESSARRATSEGVSDEHAMIRQFWLSSIRRNAYLV